MPMMAFIGVRISWLIWRVGGASRGGMAGREGGEGGRGSEKVEGEGSPSDA